MKNPVVLTVSICALLLVLARPGSAQFDYTTNNGTITITGYTGEGVALAIPGTINGLPVTEIGESAFEDADVSSVTIPDSVTSIGASAFYNCADLTNISIGNAVGSIGDNAFAFSGLTMVTIPNSVTNLGNGTFYPCYSLTSVTLGIGIARIGDNEFNYCDHLNSVAIPNSVTSIGTNAFYACFDLTNAVIGAGITNIADGGFEFCSTLGGFYFEGNAPSLGANVFNGDSATVYYVQGTTGWGGTFGGLPAAQWTYPNYTFTVADGTITITGYAGPGGAVTIPGTINGVPVTEIGPSAFYDQTSITSISIPNSVTSIDAYAFQSCTGLTSFTIPNSVTYVGYEAFDFCPNLASITIGSGVTYITDYAFANCGKLTGFYFEGSAPSLGLNVFYTDNTAIVYYLPGTTGFGSTFGGLTATLWTYPGFNFIDNNGAITITGYSGHSNVVTIPGIINGVPVTGIGMSAFYDLTSVTSVTIPNGVTTIGTNAFYQCFGLTNVSLPGSLTSIDDQAFAFCQSLTSVAMPNSVTNLGASAFGFCYDLGSVTLSTNLTSLAQGVFNDCSDLTNVMIPSGVTNIGAAAFEYCGSLSGVAILANVSSIGQGAFLGCSELKAINVDPQNAFYSSVNGVLFNKNQTTLIQFPGGFTGNYAIPDSVTGIGTGAFENCSGLSNLLVSSNVTSIGDYAFEFCTGVTNLYFEGNAPSLGSGVFYNDPATVYYVAGTTGWTNFNSESGLSAAVEWPSAGYFVVNSTNDSGPGTLRTAIAIDNYGSTITFATNLSGATIAPSNTLVINQSLAIDASALTNGIQINGNGAVRIMAVSPDVSSVNTIVILNSLTLTNGTSSFGGGAIWNTGTLTLNNCQLSGNSATGDMGAGGGAIWSAGNLILSYCTLSRNAASGGSFGGGIYNQGQATLSHCTLSENSTGGTSDFVDDSVYSAGNAFGMNASGGDGYGGGIYNTGGLVLDNCDISENEAFGGFAEGGWAYGGDETAPGNGTGGNATGGNGFGGGIFNYNGMVTLNSSTLWNNEAGGGEAIGGYGFGENYQGNPYGGGIGYGGAAYAGTGYGGGICNFGSLTLNQCTLYENWAIAGDANPGLGVDEYSNFQDVDNGYGPSSPGNGDGAAIGNFNILEMNQCTLSQNRASNLGGGIYSSAGRSTLVNCTLSINIASGSGVGIYEDESYPGTVVLTNTIVAGNSGVTDIFGSSGSFSITSSLTNGNPLLGPLGFYGGPVETMPPLPGSPAINAGDDWVTNFLTTDERGYPRLSGSHVDIGAVELPSIESWTATPTNLLQGLIVQFYGPNADSEGSPIVGWNWNFGDGAVGSGQNPLHVYTNSGIFAPVLVVNNNLGLAIQSFGPSITVLPRPFIISQPSNETVFLGGTVSLSVGVGGTGPFSYEWQFNGVDLTNDIISTVAGDGNFSYTGDGALATATGMAPLGVAVDASGNLFIADGNRVRKVDTNGIITTVAGNGLSSYSGDGGPATNAGLKALGVAVDGVGNLFIADGGLGGNGRVRRVGANGIITTVAGGGVLNSSGDGGAATNASLSPVAVAMDTQGNLFIADQSGMCVRKVDTNGIITTVAGNGSPSDSGDGGPATSAGIDPAGVAVDGWGNLFIADAYNNCVRQVSVNGIITTVAGNPTGAFPGDGGPATNAVLSQPQAVAVDSWGNLFIADSAAQRVREVSTNGIITTVAGNGMEGFSGDGGAATNASLRRPVGIGVDATDDLFIADNNNARVRKVTDIELSPVLSLSGVTASNAGNYSVIIRNPYASITSSPATLSVATAPFLSGVGRSPGGGITLTAFSPPGSTNVVLVTSSLAAPVFWQPIATNVAGDRGLWQFSDPATGPDPARYYSFCVLPASINKLLFRDTFDPQTGAGIGISYDGGDLVNPSVGVVSGAGTSGSAALEIRDSVSNGPNGYAYLAGQWQALYVTGNTDTNLSDYYLSFDAYVDGDASHQSGGGFSFEVQEGAGTNFSTPFPQGQLQTFQPYQGGSDLMLPESRVWTHFSINLGGPRFQGANGTNITFNPTGGTWQLIFQLNSGDWGVEPQTNSTLIIDNILMTVHAPL